jgi:electron transport complex protein RnfB
VSAIVYVATDACKGCGACLATCPERALRPAPGGWLELGGPPLLTLAERCTGCAECLEICPADAFVAVPVEEVPWRA